MSKSETGRIGEDIACEYLIGKGYRILKRNYWKPWGEIDIIAVAKTNTLIFIEVKALKENSSAGLLPEDNLTSAKLAKLQRACRKFVADKPDLVREDRGWQIDLVAVSIPVADKPDLKNCDIRHYENI